MGHDKLSEEIHHFLCIKMFPFGIKVKTLFLAQFYYPYRIRLKLAEKAM